MRRTLCLTVAALSFATAALAGKPHYEIAGRVVKIADGDTLTVLDGSNVQHKIRLAGIDAPEKGQPFGTKARQALADKVFGQTVRVEVIVGVATREAARLADSLTNERFFVRLPYLGRWIRPAHSEIKELPR